jgi:hypothetical protein
MLLVSLCTRCAPNLPLYIQHDIVIAIVIVDHSSDNNNDDTSMHTVICKRRMTRGRTRWVTLRLSLMCRNLT